MTYSMQNGNLRLDTNTFKLMKLTQAQNYTHKTKGTFEGAMGAIQAYHSLSDQVEPFWLLLESHFGGLIEPERL